MERTGWDGVERTGWDGVERTGWDGVERTGGTAWRRNGWDGDRAHGAMVSRATLRYRRPPIRSGRTGTYLTMRMRLISPA